MTGNPADRKLRVQSEETDEFYRHLHRSCNRAGRLQQHMPVADPRMEWGRLARLGTHLRVIPIHTHPPRGKERRVGRSGGTAGRLRGNPGTQRGSRWRFCR